MVLQICNPSYMGDTGRKTAIQGWLSKSMTLSEKPIKAKRLEACLRRPRVQSPMPKKKRVSGGAGKT
jgi:hypothetical protein